MVVLNKQHAAHEKQKRSVVDGTDRSDGPTHWHRAAGRARLARYGGPGTALLLLAAMFSACSSSSAKVASSSSSTSPASSYFAGKTITLIAPDGPGGDGDLSARAIAPGLAQELHATVDVTDMPGDGSIVGTNALYSAPPDGLTLGVVHLGTDIASIAEHRATGVKFNLEKFSWIGNETEQPFVIGTQPSSPYKTFASLVHSTSPNTVITSTTDYGINVIIYSLFHIKHDFLTGYPSGSSEKQGFLANQGQNFNSFAGIVSSLIASDQMRALAVSTEPTLPALKTDLAGVPTLAQEVKQLHLSLTKTGQSELSLAETLPEYFVSLAAPPGLSTAKLDTLRTAFAKAMTLASTKALAAKSKEPQYYVNGATTAAEVPKLTSASQILSSLAP